METTPCKATPTKPVTLTDAILGKTRGGNTTTKAQLHVRIKWHANNCSELAAWIEKPLHNKDRKTLAAMARAIHIRHSRDRSILPRMPHALIQAVTHTTEHHTDPLLGTHAPAAVEWEVWAGLLRETAKRALEHETRRLRKHGKAM